MCRFNAAREAGGPVGHLIPRLVRILKRAGNSLMAGILALAAGVGTIHAAENVRLVEVPDYEWHAGCFGTASGNLMGFWDRHGLPGLYTGPTRGGVAPLTSFGSNAGIRSLWASEAGVDGRAFNSPGHLDDYWVEYESVQRDPYLAAGRAEHAPDCIGDFIGLSQSKWADLGGECAGNIDGFSFNFFDRTGRRRDNYTPPGAVPDVQSGLRRWAASRGYGLDTFSQLSDFHPECEPGQGFTFSDLRAEIDAGFPVLLFMQAFDEYARTVFGRPRQNPNIHAMLAYGYLVDDNGDEYVRYRTSWASGDNQFSRWTNENWTPLGELNLPLRGVIGVRPRPRITRVERTATGVRLRWEGPASVVRDELLETEWIASSYVVERSDVAQGGVWIPVAGPMTTGEVEVSDCCGGTVFFRLKLVPTKSTGVERVAATSQGK
ncbi:MAG: hypothetical protein IT580_22360 [Verrucomicrobiales bacterium]|nr:hypothetical protein [Verrucomicrobiales bacterium]